MPDYISDKLVKQHTMKPQICQDPPIVHRVNPTANCEQYNQVPTYLVSQQVIIPHIYID